VAGGIEHCRKRTRESTHTAHLL